LTANIEYEVPTWSQIYDMLLSQTQKIHSSSYEPDIIVSVARGGVIPGRILTDLLEASEFAMIQVEFYVDIAQPTLQPTLKQALTAKIMGKKTLLVDDIADTGKSLKLAKTHLEQQGASQIMTATLYTKPHSTTTPDFFERQASRWVVFPWDAKETLRRIVQKQQGRRSLNHEVAKLVKAGLPKQVAQKLLEDTR
jgi:hypoxanthine phosphoribosyltransferase